MKEYVVELLQNYMHYAYGISILINIIISIVGFVPSLFLTAANLIVFGFWKGTIVSFVGEGIGVVVSFFLYRIGFSRFSETKMFNHSLVRRLLDVEGKQAFVLVLSLRLLPFVPSGLITFFAAIGKMEFWVFALSSLFGKIPALMFEAYSVNHIIKWTWQGKAFMTILATGLLISILRRIFRKASQGI